MEDFLDCQSPTNPWVKSMKHPLDDVITMLHGAVGQDMPDDEMIDEAYSNSPAAKQLNALRELAQTSAEIRRHRRAIVKLENEKGCSDLTRADALKSKLEAVENLVAELESIVKGEETLRLKLQRPFESNQLPLEAKYHGKAVKLFANLSLSLSDLQTHLNTIEHLGTRPVDDEKVSDKLRDLSRRYGELRESYRVLSGALEDT